MKKILTLALLSGHLVQNGITAYAETNNDLSEVISTIETDANTLPIEQIKAKGSGVSDLANLLQQKRKAISKKIAEVTNATKPKPKVESKKQELKHEIKTEKSAKITEPEQSKPNVVDGVQFGANGLLIEQASSHAQAVVNGLLGIPGHSNGAYYHRNGLDAQINALSTAEAIWVIHRIEGAGFGQTGDGYAGYDTPASHKTFINHQVNRRFGGSVHALLRAWGTFSYGGY